MKFNVDQHFITMPWGM